MIKLLTNDPPTTHHPTITYSHRCRSRMTNRYCNSNAICRPGRPSGPVRQVSLGCCRGRPTRTVHARALLRCGRGTTTTAAAAAQSSPTPTPPPTRAREGSHCCSTGSHVFVCATQQRVEALRRHCRPTAVVCTLLTFRQGGRRRRAVFFTPPQRTRRHRRRACRKYNTK